MNALCHFLDAWWQDFIEFKQSEVPISHQGCLAMRAELQQVYDPMEPFVDEYINHDPQHVPVFGSMDDFLNEEFGPDDEEELNEDGIPVDLIFPDNE